MRAKTATRQISTKVEHHTPSVCDKDDARVPSFIQSEEVAETCDNEWPPPEPTPEDILSTPEGRAEARC